MLLISRRRALATAAGFGTHGLAAEQAQAKVFRIGTGGTYYRVGGVIGNAISTDNISLSAVVTNGSVGNIHAIASGALESGFS